MDAQEIRAGIWRGRLAAPAKGFVGRFLANRCILSSCHTPYSRALSFVCSSKSFKDVWKIKEEEARYVGMPTLGVSTYEELDEENMV